MKNTGRAIEAINRGIAAIDDAIAIGNRPFTGPTSMDQLGEFRHQLLLMLNEVENQTLLNQERPLRRIGPIIADSWPLESGLGEVLLKAENEYVRYMAART